jgi:hypothetical protein
MPKTLRRGRTRARGRKGGTRKKLGKKTLIIEESSSSEPKMSSLDTEPQLSETKSSTGKYSKPHIVTTFFQMLNTVKLYHWKTCSYAQHKATDDLYSKLNESIDSFVEIMLGKKGDRVNLTETKTIPLHDYNELSTFEKEIEMYKDYLIGMSSHFDSKLDSDLLNTRDELLGHLNQFTYLLTFK